MSAAARQGHQGRVIPDAQAPVIPAGACGSVDHQGGHHDRPRRPVRTLTTGCACYRCSFIDATRAWAAQFTGHDDPAKLALVLSDAAAVIGEVVPAT